MEPYSVLKSIYYKEDSTYFKQSLEMPKKVFLIRVEHVAVSILQYLFFLPLRVTPFVAEAICYVLQGGLSAQ